MNKKYDKPLSLAEWKSWEQDEAVLKTFLVAAKTNYPDLLDFGKPIAEMTHQEARKWAYGCLKVAGKLAFNHYKPKL